MNVVGIGTDIVHLPRIARIIAKYGRSSGSSSMYRITKKFMAGPERLRFQTLLTENNSELDMRNAVRYMAGVWATKESLLKALSCYVPVSELPPAQTIYSKLFCKKNLSSGVPIVQILEDFPTKCPEYKDFYYNYIFHDLEALISISHDQDYLICYSCLLSQNIPGKTDT